MSSSEIQSWDARFAGEEYLFGREPNHFVTHEARRIAAGGRVLAVADGEGRNGVWLAEQGFAVHSVEGSALAVEKAIRLAEERGVPVVASLDALVPGSILPERGDVLTPAWPARSYQGVVAIFVQFAKPGERETLFDAMAAALEPGGVLLLEGYALRQLALGTGGPSSIDHLYDEALLRSAFRDLRIESFVEYDMVLREGRQHSGSSALVDLIAVAP
jgi:hypothetical protein